MLPQDLEFGYHTWVLAIDAVAFVSSIQLVEQRFLSGFRGKGISQEEIHPWFGNASLSSLFLPEGCLEHRPACIHQVLNVLVIARGAMEDVVADEIHCCQRFAAKIERLKDNLRVVRFC
jgi:hypothetical protein